MTASSAVQIAADAWWLADRGPERPARNLYLLSQPLEERRLNMLVDPGPPLLLSTLARECLPMTGGLEYMDAVLVTRAAADAFANTQAVRRKNPRCALVAAEDTARMLRACGLGEERLRTVESYPAARVTLPTGRDLEFVPAPFCPERGAMMYYDVESQVLFSGDLLSGSLGGRALFATEADWPGIETFHRLYMPSGEALRLAVSRIQALEPPPEIIAPRLGGLVRGDLIRDFLERLRGLETGLELLRDQAREEFHKGAANAMLAALEEELGRETLADCLACVARDPACRGLFVLADSRIRGLKTEPAEALRQLVKKLRKALDPRHDDLLNLVVAKVLVSRGMNVGEILSPDEPEPELPDYFE